MKVIVPQLITEGTLVSSTVAEDDYATWSDSTTYAVGDRVIYQHRIYESLQNLNTNHNPETDSSDPPYWLDVGPTNRFAMFDTVVNTATTSSDDIVVEVQQNAIVDAVGFIELTATSVRVTMYDGAAVVYDQTKSLDATVVLDWYDYFFADFDWFTDAVFFDVPPVLNGKLQVTIATREGAAAVGAMLVGRLVALGRTQYGATAGITDYSKKTTNTFGAVTLLQRAYAKRMNATMFLETAEMRRVQSTLAALRATPVLWVGDDDTATYAPLVVYGWYRDFQIEIPYPGGSLCSIDIEGMT